MPRCLFARPPTLSVQQLCAARYCGDVLQMSSDARGGARDVAIALSTASSRRAGVTQESIIGVADQTESPQVGRSGGRATSDVKAHSSRDLKSCLKASQQPRTSGVRTRFPSPPDPPTPMPANFLDKFVFLRLNRSLETYN